MTRGAGARALSREPELEFHVVKSRQSLTGTRFRLMHRVQHTNQWSANRHVLILSFRPRLIVTKHVVRIFRRAVLGLIEPDEAQTCCVGRPVAQ